MCIYISYIEINGIINLLTRHNLSMTCSNYKFNVAGVIC